MRGGLKDVGRLGSAAVAATASLRPRLRGVSHKYAFFASLACGVALIVTASGGKSTIAAAIYAGAVSALFGTSALYHRITWRPRARRWIRRVDHSMIFVLIAGTYTPVALLALSGTLATAVLWAVWGAAAAGVVFKLLWIDAPKWLFAAVYLALGWVSAAILGQLPAAIGWLV
jgi:hemolysin III